MPYYNTTKETDNLEIKEIRTKKQDKKIYLLFKEHKELGSSDVFRLWHDKKTPITSIRRSFNTLMNKGKIYKTGKKQDSYYNGKEFVYKIIE